MAFFAPARRGSDTPMPDTGSRQDGVQPYIWTMREFCRERLLRFVFVDGEDARAQIHLVISRVEQALEFAAREGDRVDCQRDGGRQRHRIVPATSWTCWTVPAWTR